MGSLHRFLPSLGKMEADIGRNSAEIKVFSSQINQHLEETQINQGKKNRSNLADALSGLVPKYSQVVRLATGYDNIGLTVSIEISCFDILNRRLLSA